MVVDWRSFVYKYLVLPYDTSFGSKVELSSHFTVCFSELICIRFTYNPHLMHA
jgi:hypothetical protein